MANRHPPISMKPKREFAALALICLTATSVFAMLGSTAVANNVLSTPEYTVQYLDNSYDTPPTWKPDPYTDEPKIETPRQRVNIFWGQKAIT